MKFRQNPFIIKARITSKWMEGSLPPNNETFFKNPKTVANFVLNGENLKAFSLKPGRRQDVYSLHCYSALC
jgi:hypothetical protein